MRDFVSLAPSATFSTVQVGVERRGAAVSPADQLTGGFTLRRIFPALKHCAGAWHLALKPRLCEADYQSTDYGEGGVG